MASKFENVLSPEDIEYINNLPEVLVAKNKLENSNKVYFSICLTDSIREALSQRFEIDFTGINELPMRWIKEDTLPHIDVGSSSFENTYLVYLNNNSGNFIVDDESYNITENTGFKFSEGLSHKTVNTGVEPRLLIGPMSEKAFAVGVTIFSYYANQTDALSGISSNDWNNGSTISGNSGVRIAYRNFTGIESVGDVTDGSIGATTYWSILDISGNYLGNYLNGVPESSLSIVNGQIYYLYSLGGGAPCFLEGSQILCLVDEKETYLPIEQMKKGTLVKTTKSGYKMVHIIGKRDIPNFNDSNRIKDRLYKLTSAQYPALISDLYLTGCHSTLVDSLTEEQKDEIKKLLGVVCVTEGKYRLPACIDNNAEPWQSKGTYTVWHFALDDEDPRINFGVYANGGLIVETGSIRYLQEKANMELV